MTIAIGWKTTKRMFDISTTWEKLPMAGGLSGILRVLRFAASTECTPMLHCVYVQL